MIYLWSAWGLQLFGGQLFESNPALKEQKDDLDYFGSHFQVYNFNDMLMAMVTMFFVTITNWSAQVAVVTMALSEHMTFSWLLTCTFWLTFYIGSPLIAFNVFTAFSIDVFCKIQEMMDPDAMKKTEVETNLAMLQGELAEKGLVLHIEESAELQRERVYAAMFEEDEEEDDDDNDKNGDGGAHD